MKPKMKKNAEMKPAITSDSWEKSPPDSDQADEEKERMGEIDLDHLLKSEQIKSDPKKMEYVKRAHKKKLTHMTSIQDLKDYHEAKYGEGSDKKE